MAKESIRFLHAGDFHLERAMQDLTDLPEHLKSSLADAPWKAAESVFEAAIVEEETGTCIAPNSHTIASKTPPESSACPCVEHSCVEHWLNSEERELGHALRGM